MAALTWRNVDAPDLGTAIRGVESFSRLWGDAFAGADRALGKFDAKQDEFANRQALENALRIRDSEAYKNALASGSILDGVNRNRVSLDTLQALDRRTGTLLNQELTGQNLSDAKYQSGRTRAEDMGAAGLSEATRIAQTGDRAALDKYLAANPNLTKGMGARTVMDFTTGLQRGEAGAVDIAGARQRQTFDRNQENRTGILFDRGTLDYNEGRRNEAILADMAGQGYTAADIDRYIADKGITGNAAYNLRRSAGGFLAPDLAGGSLGSGGGSGPAALGMTYGGGALPDNIQTVGDFVANKSNLVRSLGASPVGMYQINADTWSDFAPKVLGSGWQTASVRDPKVQDAVGKAIFESTNRDPAKLMGRWASLSASQAQAISKMPWEQAREVIAQGESRSSPAALLTVQGATARQGTANRIMQTNGDGIATQIQSALGTNDASEDQVATDVAKNFKGANVGQLANQISLIKAKAREMGVTLNNRAAGVILTNSAGIEDRWFFPGLQDSWSSTPVGLGENRRIDPDAVERHIRSIASGGVQDTAVANQVLAQKTTAVNQTVAVEQAALQRLQAARAAALRNPNYNPRLLQEAEITYQRAAQARYLAQQTEGRDNDAAGAMAGQNYYGNRQAPPRPQPPRTVGRPTGGGTVVAPAGGGQKGRSGKSGFELLSDVVSGLFD